ncbi:MAG: hypothetical protein K1W17_08105 [Oscillospiraceae bacterium]
MKKFLAALLAVPITAAFAGCDKPAGEPAAGDTADTFSEALEAAPKMSETVLNTEEAATETAAEIVPETETKTSAETEKTVENMTETKETSAETTDGTVSESQFVFANYDNAKFPIGVWRDNYVYTYECDEYGNSIYNYYDENNTNIYSSNFKNYTESDAKIYDEKIFQKDSHTFEFDGEGHYRISLETHDVLGEYTLEDNMLTLIFKNDYSEETFINRFCFEASKNENGYRLEFVPSKSTEMIELPAVRNMEHSADVELFVGLSALFDTFYARKSFCIEYIGEADADSFKDYIEYLKDIS